MRGSTIVEGGQGGSASSRLPHVYFLTVDVFGIDEAAADAGLHVDKVKLYDTRDGSPVLTPQAVALAQLSGQFQVDA